MKKSILFPIIIIFMVLLVSCPQQESLTPGGAMVAWEPGTINEILGNGRHITKPCSVRFRTNETINNIDLIISSDIKPFLKIGKYNFSKVQEGRNYTIHIDFNIPEHTEQRTYKGTISLRSGDRFITGNLEVTINVDFGDIIVSDSVRRLSKSAIEEISSISEDKSAIVFKGINPEISSLKAGNIIVAGTSNTLPEGLLRKVATVNVSGNQVTMTTTGATIEDIIIEGTINVSGSLLSEADMRNLDIYNKAQNLLLRAKGLRPPQGFRVDFPDFVLYDLDGDRGTTYDQIILNGYFYLDPWVDIEIDKDRPAGPYLRFAPSITVTALLEVEAKVTVSLVNLRIPIPLSWLIGLNNIPPFTVWVGPVPLVFKLGVNAITRLEGEAYAGLKTSVIQQNTGQIGLEYSGGNFTPVINLNSEFEFQPPGPEAGVNLKASLGLEISLRLYGIVGPFVEPDYYLSFESDIFDDPWWRLYGGYEVRVGINDGIPLINLVHWEYTLPFGYKQLITQAPGPFWVEPTPTQTPVPTITMIPTPIPTAPTSVITPIPTNPGPATPAITHPPTDPFRFDPIPPMPYQKFSGYVTADLPYGFVHMIFINGSQEYEGEYVSVDDNDGKWTWHFTINNGLPCGTYRVEFRAGDFSTGKDDKKILAAATTLIID